MTSFKIACLGTSEQREVVQLRTKEEVDSLREQKRNLEEEFLSEIADELVCLRRNQRSVHVELIQVLVCENPECIAFLMHLNIPKQQPDYYYHHDRHYYYYYYY